MSLIPILEGDIVEYHGNGVPAFARLYANQQFTTDDSVVVAAGSVKKPAFYQEFGASLVGTWIRVAEGDAYATTNSNKPLSTYTLAVYDAKGRVLVTPYYQLRIPHQNSPTTWRACELFSSAVPMTYPPHYLDAETILALIEEMDGLTEWGQIGGSITDQHDLATALANLAAPATVSRLGLMRPNVAPANAADPVALGINDPTWQSVKGATVYLSTYAGVTNAGDCTAHFNSAFAVLAALGGGTLKVGPGVWKASELLIPNHVVIEGSGQPDTGVTPDLGQGARIELFNPASDTFLMKVPPGGRNVVLRDLKLYAGTSATAPCLIMEGGPLSTIGVKCSNVTFQSNATDHPGSVQMYGSGMGGEIVQVLFDQCQFASANDSKDLTCDSKNTAVTMINPQHNNGTGGTSVYGTFGWLTVINRDARGGAGYDWTNALDRTITQASIAVGTKDLSIATGALSKDDEGQHVLIAGKLDSYITRVLGPTTARVRDNATATATNDSMNVYRVVPPTLTAKAYLHLAGERGMINIIGGAEEGYTNTIINDVPTYSTPICLVSTLLQGQILLNQACVLSMTGCTYSSNAIIEGAGTQSIIYSSGNRVGNVTLHSGVALEWAKPWGPRNGGYSYFAQQADSLGYGVGGFGSLPWQRTELPMRFEQKAGFGGGIPLVSIGAVDQIEGVDAAQVLLRLGCLNPVTEEDFLWYDFRRSATTGYLEIKGNQGDPFNGVDVRGALVSSSPTGGIGYIAGAGGAVVQPTSKSTNVLLNKPSGQITMNAEALAAGAAVTFGVSNSMAGGNDVVVICHKTGGTMGGYTVTAHTFIGDGAFWVTVRNVTAGALSEALVLQFVIIRGASS